MSPDHSEIERLVERLSGLYYALNDYRPEDDARGLLELLPHHAETCELARTALLNAIREREPVGWRPIETAPRDGTLFLVTGDPVGVVNVGGWLSEPEHRNEGVVIQERDGGRCYVAPTHWMPLPPAVVPMSDNQ